MTDIAIGTWLNGEPAKRWDEVLSSDVKKRRDALTFWAKNRDILPGPLAFTLQPVSLLFIWERVMQESDAQCVCGRRRVLMPTNSTPFYPPDSSVRYSLGPVHRPLYLAPWGGDAQSSFMWLSAGSDSLTQQFMPFSNPSQVLPEASKIQPVEEAPFNLEEIAKRIEATDAPCLIPVDIHLGEAGSAKDQRRTVTFYPFAVTAVHARTNTVIIAPNRATAVVDATNRGNFHKCG